MQLQLHYTTLHCTTLITLHCATTTTTTTTIYLSLCLSIYLSICLSVYLQSASLKTQQFCETSSTFELDNVKKEAILRDCLEFLKLAASKTCKTSSILEVDNIKNKAILRDFLQKWKVECRADGRVPMRFAIFPLHLSKVLRLPQKKYARSYEVLHLSRKIISSNLQIWCSKMNPSQKISALTS